MGQSFHSGNFVNKKLVIPATPGKRAAITSSVRAAPTDTASELLLRWGLLVGILGV